MSEINLEKITTKDLVDLAINKWKDISEMGGPFAGLPSYKRDYEFIERVAKLKNMEKESSFNPSNEEYVALRDKTVEQYKEIKEENKEISINIGEEND